MRNEKGHITTAPSNPPNEELYRFSDDGKVSYIVSGGMVVSGEDVFPVSLFWHADSINIVNNNISIFSFMLIFFMQPLIFTNFSFHCSF
ncbi:MAG: hypothetical protein J5725_01125 [Bacteroidales bacterium]|nr:hypothetical protein [Bacteroidales bacterium]